jgi:hypothetical protein
MNFGNSVSELQMALVLAHEIGHNFGANHDESMHSVPELGMYLMCAASVLGNDVHNKLFSPASIAEMSAVLADRAGCFAASNSEDDGFCGNFIRDGGEACDCGGRADTCTQFDTCCTAKCEFNPSREAECSPLDHQHGACCTSNCALASVNTTCRKQGECIAVAVCNVQGKCPLAGSKDEQFRPVPCSADVSICLPVV